MKLKAVRKFWSGVKLIKQDIKSYRHESSSKTLALKRQEAENYVETISDATWDKISKSVFEQKGDSRSILLDKLQNYKKFCDENGIEMPPDVLEAYKRLVHKATVFADRMAIAKSKGKTPENYWVYGDKFKKNNQEAFSKLKEFAVKQQDAAMKNWDTAVFQSTYDPKAIEEAKQIYIKIYNNRLDVGYIPYEEMYNTKIGTVADEIIKNGQIFYHGTKHQRAITQNGFHVIPKNVQAAIAARELGQGVYLTPDKKVASRYAGIRGGILQMKVDTKKVAVVNNAQMDAISREVGSNFEISQLTPETLELIIKKLFQRNGYNAAYTKEALGSGLFAPNKIVDALAGGKQSQLVVFAPKDITILDKTLRTRIENQSLQIGTVLATPARILNYIREERKKYIKHKSI